jgi:hypothetical protein
MYRNYDSWKASNLYDDHLGPDPDLEPEGDPEQEEEENSMTPNQYKAAINTLGLSQERAGVWLGIGKRTSQGYALGEYPVPEPVAKLLRLMIKQGLKPEDVR